MIEIELYESGGALFALTVDEHGNGREACILPPDGHADHADDLPVDDGEVKL